MHRMTRSTLTEQSKARIRELTKLRASSLPSLTLFVTAYLLWAATIYLYFAARVSSLSALCLCVLSFVVGYTPFHEAVHGSVSKIRFVNAWVGRLAASMLFSPYQGFRYVHLKHHRFTNRSGIDPDLWSARGLVLFRWLTQDLYYYFVYLKERKKNSTRVRIEVVLQSGILLGLAFWACSKGCGGLIFWCWILPARIAIAWLSFTFTWLPHHPHDEKSQDNAFKATCVRTSRWLSAPLFFQNYHLIHHLYPSVPFYRYTSIWNEGKEHFLAQGTREVKEIWKI
jgi:fatty acid desaturase